MGKNCLEYVNHAWTKKKSAHQNTVRTRFHVSLKKKKFIAALTIGITCALGRLEGNYASDRALAKAVSSGERVSRSV